MTLYHGTNYEAAMNIIENGFESPDTIWSCSEDTMTYFIRETDDEYYALQFAIDAAKISAAHFNSQSTAICVFKIEISDDIFDDEFLPDISCENMNDCYCIESDRLNKLVDTSVIKMSLLRISDAYNMWLRPFYLTGLSEYYVCNDATLERAMNCINNNNAHINMCDDLYEYGSIDESEILPRITA